MYTLLIPREQSLKEKKSGRNAPFWKGYWGKRLQENPTYYKKQYVRRVNSLSRAVNLINNKYQSSDKKYYVEARFDKFVDVKTKEPTELWKETGVQIVETRKDGTVTLSGNPNAFRKLAELFGSADFNIASQEKLSKKQNISREVFSVTAIIDKNASPNKRISKELVDFVASGSTEKIKCILSVYYDQDRSKYDKLYNVLIQKLSSDSITKVDERFFVSNMSFRGNLTGVEIKKLLEDQDCNFINFIKPVLLFSTQRTTPSVTPNNLQIGHLLTDEKIVIIDSGINNSVINSYVTQRENFLDSGDIQDTNHGTSVASRLLFGDDIFSATQAGKQVNPVGKLIDIKVIHQDIKNRLFVPDDRLMKAIEQSIRRYKPIATIYNLSISAEQEVDESKVSEITEMIDDFSNKNDILFVCAVGNQTGNFSLGYNGIFTSKNIDCHIASPSDALNALSVGSITSIADINSICQKSKLPSPFTRKGGIRNDCKKPELIAQGGNIKTDPSGVYDIAHLQTSHRAYGVEVIDSNGFNRDVGTSFSAPLISRECAQLLNYLKKSSITSQLPTFSQNKANLIKALLIHSTERVKQSILPNEAIKRAYGWGQPSSQAIVKDDDNQVTIIYADKINFSDKKQKVLIKLPEFLMNKPVEIIFTLVYNPPVNKNFVEYKMIDLQPSIGFIHPGENEEGEKETTTRSNTPAHSWENYRCSSFNTIHFKKTRKRVTGLDFQILIQMLVSNRLLDEYEGHHQDIFQNYALVLTVRDKSSSGQLRNKILESNQFFELIENTIQIEN